MLPSPRLKVSVMDDATPTRHPPASTDSVGESLTDGIAFRVLASSSRGNCSVLVITSAGRRRVFLIDAGLSPRRTSELLASTGLAADSIAGVILTHLDHDHWHPGWLSALPEGCTVHIHRRHRGRAERGGMLYLRTNVFETDFEIAPGVDARPVLGSHDDLGVAAFRFDFGRTGRALGFATDLGRATDPLVEHLEGVDVLAIESNYCPRLQAASLRPDFLKRRITGGSGHLSNEQAAEAAARIAPREHTILLHLSLDCNTPDRARRGHAWAPYALTLAHDTEPTPWIPLMWGSAPARQPRRVPTPTAVAPSLWESARA